MIARQLRATLCLLLLAGARPGVLAGQTGWKATVKSDAAPVYSGMSSSSKLVKSLHKGDAVLIEVDLATAQGHWCSVREPGSAARTGYVLCENLEREKPAPRISRAPSAAPPSKELIAECKPLVDRAMELSGSDAEIKQLPSVVQMQLNAQMQRSPGLTPAEKRNFSAIMRRTFDPKIIEAQLKQEFAARCDKQVLVAFID